MIRSLYSGVSGMRTHQIRMDVIGNNIANVNNIGYKANRANFQDMLYQTLNGANGSNLSQNYGGSNPNQVGAGVTLAGISANMTPGALQTTWRSLDVAIQGNGFFVVQKPDGNLYATREGIFFLDNEGYLVNTDGYFVCNDQGKPIQFDNAEQISSIAISDKGDITVTNDGGTETETLGLAFFINPEGLEKVGGNLYRPTDASGGNDNGSIDPDNIGKVGEDALVNTLVHSGYLEMSNVDLTEEMTNMMTTQRGYQANARVITVSDSLLQELIDLKR